NDAEAAAAQAQPVNAKQKPALQIESDMFLFKNGAARKSGKKLVVELEGPDPASGEWVQHEDKGDVKTAWRWVPTEDKGKPQSGSGWVHEGDKPVFNPSTRKWQLAGEKPDLSYQKDKKKTASKVTTSATGEIEVAEDSPKAAENLRAITAKWNPAALTPEERKAAAAIAAAKAAPEEDKNNLASMNLVKKDAPSGGFQDKAGAQEPKPEGKDLSYSGSTLPESKELSLKDKKKTEESEELVLKDRKKRPPRKPGEKMDSGEEEELARSQARGLLGKTEKPEAEEEKTNPALAFLEKKKTEAKERKVAGTPEKTTEPEAKTSEKIESAPEKKSRSTPDREIPAAKKKERPPRDPGESKADRLKRLMAGMESEDEEDDEAPPVEARKKSPRTEEKKDKLARLREKLLGEKRALTEELTEELARPIPSTLTPEEEAEARQELGITDPSVTPKELARKKKFHKLKSLKDKLKDFDADILDASEEAEKPDPKAHDLKADDPENTWSQKDLSAQPESKRKLNAFDSDVSEDELAEQEKKKALLGNGTRKNRDENVREPEFFRKESEILPLGGAWESTGFYFVYLDALTRYKGFSTVESLLPLWIYEGERVPELLSKTKEWRFFSREPVRATEMSQVPIEVVDFLKNLNEQIQRGEGRKKDHKDDKADRLAALKDRLGGDREEEDGADEAEIRGEELTEKSENAGENTKKIRTMADKTVELEAKKKARKEELEAGKTSFANDEDKKKKRETETKADRLAALKARMGKDGAEASTDEEEPLRSGESRQDEPEELNASPDKKKKSRGGDDKADRLAALKARMGEDGAEASTDEEETLLGGESPSEGAEELNASPDKKKKSRGGDDKADRLAALKEKLGAGEKSEEDGDTSAIGGDRKKPEEAPPSDASSARVEEKLSEQSPAMKKFFERRKKKAETSAHDTVIDYKPRDPGGPVAFLGVYVALSDAVYKNKEFPRTATRMAKAISIAVENSFATFARAKDPEGTDAEVMGSANLQHPVGSAIDAKAPPRIPFELRNSAGDVMGWLIIEPSPPRAELTPNETEALKDTAAKVAQLWEARENEEKRKQAA
ncbi:MAG: hypothetical protein HUU37_03360, partial [Bdellovibrionales bacterium]|nr:hypothetical protein [Bdellovibrionales bacterium]